MSRQTEEEKVREFLEGEGINVDEFVEEKEALMGRKQELDARLESAGTALSGPSVEVQ